MCGFSIRRGDISRRDFLRLGHHSVFEQRTLETGPAHHVWSQICESIYAHLPLKGLAGCTKVSYFLLELGAAGAAMMGFMRAIPSRPPTIRPVATTGVGLTSVRSAVSGVVCKGGVSDGGLETDEKARRRPAGGTVHDIITTQCTYSAKQGCGGVRPKQRSHPVRQKREKLPIGGVYGGN